MTGFNVIASEGGESAKGMVSICSEAISGIRSDFTPWDCHAPFCGHRYGSSSSFARNDRIHSAPIVTARAVPALAM